MNNSGFAMAGINGYADNVCFLCGKLFDIDRPKTIEHIFPKWILNKYKLWNEKVVLLNGTEIPIRNATIPCCIECNGQYLSEIESQIKSGLDSGYTTFSKLDDLIIWQWVCKIAYGLLRKQRFLSMNRSVSSDETIVDDLFLKLHGNIGDFLKSIKTDFEFENKPYSLFIFPIHKTNKIEFKFNQRCILNNSIVAVKILIDNIGMIIILNDFNFSGRFFEKTIDDIDDSILFDFQIEELFSVICYKISLIKNTFGTIFIPKGETIHVTNMIMSEDKSHNVNHISVHNWNEQVYYSMLIKSWEPYISVLNGFFGHIPKSSIYDDMGIILNKKANWDVDMIRSFYPA